MRMTTGGFALALQPAARARVGGSGASLAARSASKGGSRPSLARRATMHTARCGSERPQNPCLRCGLEASAARGAREGLLFPTLAVVEDARRHEDQRLRQARLRFRLHTLDGHRLPG